MAKDGVLDSLRKQLIPILGIWHPFKVATEKIWNEYLNIFWAPAIHAITPSAKVMKKQSLRRLTAFFTQCRLAYPKFKDRLQLMFTASCSNSSSFDPSYKVPKEMVPHLQNLYYLFTFFIPSVRFPFCFTPSFSILFKFK